MAEGRAEPGCGERRGHHAAGRAADAHRSRGGSVRILRLLTRTKLYWGLALIFLIGMLGSPVTSKGSNIFLSYGNLLDVLRQVSITGLIATGMTGVILTAGIDLSVGSLMAICSVVCAMLLTMPGWTPSAVMGLTVFALSALIVAAALVRFVLHNLARRGSAGEVSPARELLNFKRPLVAPAAAGLIAAAAALAFTLPQVESGFGLWGVL